MEWRCELYCNLSNCEISLKKKRFGGFNGIRPRGLCIHTAVLYHLSYEDPYNDKQANLMSSSTHERNETWNEVHCELQKYNCLKCDTTAMITSSFHFLSTNCRMFAAFLKVTCHLQKLSFQPWLFSYIIFSHSALPSAAYSDVFWM